MNRKDFEAIARTIKAAWPNAYPDYGAAARGHIASRMAELVPVEGRAKFLKACGCA